MPTELKPCPWCGDATAFVERADYSSCYVHCNGCGAHGPIGEGTSAANSEEVPGYAQAAELWNRRSGQPAVSAKCRTCGHAALPGESCINVAPNFPASSASLNQGDAAASSNVDELIPSAAVWTNEVDAEVVNARLDGAKGDLSAAADADPHGNSQMRDVEIHDSCSVAGIQGSPVAWRYQTPTGWHATTDAGKAACLKVDHGHAVEALGVLCIVDDAMKRSGEQKA